MSCYFRHIKDILNQAGIEVTGSNKKEIDQFIHKTVGTTYKDCSSTWKNLKQEWIVDEQKRQELVRNLRDAFH